MTNSQGDRPARSPLKGLELAVRWRVAEAVEGLGLLGGAAAGIEAAGAGGSASHWRAPAFPRSLWECLCPRKGGARVCADRASVVV